MGFIGIHLRRPAKWVFEPIYFPYSYQQTFERLNTCIQPNEFLPSPKSSSTRVFFAIVHFRHFPSSLEATSVLIRTISGISGKLCTERPEETDCECSYGKTRECAIASATERTERSGRSVGSFRRNLNSRQKDPSYTIDVKN